MTADLHVESTMLLLLYSLLVCFVLLCFALLCFALLCFLWKTSQSAVKKLCVKKEKRSINLTEDGAEQNCHKAPDHRDLSLCVLNNENTPR